MFRRLPALVAAALLSLTLGLPVAEAQTADGAGIFRLDPTLQRFDLAAQPAVHFRIPGDFDGDGDQDFLGTGVWGTPAYTALYRNDGGVFHGYWEALGGVEAPFGGNANGSLRIGDLDGDGDLDLVIPGQVQSPITVNGWIAVNDGGGTFTDVTTQALSAPLPATSDVAIGDVDGDLDLDLVFPTIGGPILVYRNRRFPDNPAALQFDAPTAVPGSPVSNRYDLCALVDVDGDDDLDFIEAGTGTASLFLNDGAGNFSLSASAPDLGSANVSALEVRDFSGDGRPDILLKDYNALRLFVNAAGTFRETTATAIPALFYANSLSCGDIEGDGDQDILVTDSFSLTGVSHLLVNNGAGVFENQASTRLQGTEPAGSSFFIDLDVDGDLDTLDTGISGLARFNVSAEPYTDTLAPHLVQARAYPRLAPTRIEITVSGYDDIGVASFDLYRDGTFLATIPQTTLRNEAIYRDYDVAEGTAYAYTTQARDAQGNLSSFSPDLGGRATTYVTYHVESVTAVARTDKATRTEYLDCTVVLLKRDLTPVASALASATLVLPSGSVVSFNNVRTDASGVAVVTYGVTRKSLAAGTYTFTVFPPTSTGSMRYDPSQDKASSATYVKAAGGGGKPK